MQHPIQRKRGETTHQLQKNKPPSVSKHLTYEQFLTTHFGEVFRLSPCATYHLDAADAALRPNYKGIWQWYRGAAKSLHAGTFLPLYLLTQSSGPAFRFMLLVGHSREAAAKQLSDLFYILKHDKEFCDTYHITPITHHFSKSNFAIRIKDTPIVFMAIGAGQSPRGLRYFGNRPDYIVCDDLDTATRARNPHRVNQLVDWVQQDLIPTSDRTFRFIMVGNRFSENTVIHKLAATNKYDLIRVNAYDTLGRLTWPEKYAVTSSSPAKGRWAKGPEGFNSENIINANEPRQAPNWFESQRALLGETAFAREYMNTPVTDGTIFKPEYITWAPAPELAAFDKLICYIDPSFSDSPVADFKAAKLWGLYRGASQSSFPAKGRWPEGPEGFNSENSNNPSALPNFQPTAAQALHCLRPASGRVCNVEQPCGGGPSGPGAVQESSFIDKTATHQQAQTQSGASAQGTATLYHLRAFVRQCSMTALVNWCYDLYEEIRNTGGAAVTFYMEANLLQGSLMQHFDDEGNRRGFYLPIRADKRHKPAKVQRIQAMAGWWERGKVIYDHAQLADADMNRGINQLLAFEPGSRLHDDGPDADEGAIHLLNPVTHNTPPPIIFPSRNARDSVW